METKLAIPSPVANLKELLLSLWKNFNGLDFYHLPQALNLGGIGYEGERVLRETLRSRFDREYANSFYTEDGQKLFTNQESVIGTSNRIEYTASGSFKRLFILHTHQKLDTPFSCGMSDLGKLFLLEKYPTAVIGTMIPTPTMQILLFRTNLTPLINSNSDWEKIYYGVAQDSNADEEEEVIRRDNYAGLTRISHKRMFGITRAAHLYHLALYAAPRGRNIATKAA